MSLRVRMLAAFGYVLVLVLIALVLPLSSNLSKRVESEVKAKAAGQAQIVAASAAGRLDRRTELSRLAATAANDLGARVIVVDRNGRVLVDSAGTERRGISYASRPEIAAALAGRTTQGQRRSNSLDEDLLATAVPVLDRGRVHGAVRVTQSVEAVNDETESDVLALIAVGLGALMLGLLVAWVIAGSLARPLRALASTARRIAGGDLDARATPEGSTEQREVTEAFNEMTERLARSLAAQREFAANASHQLRTPLTGLRLRLEAAAIKSDDPEVRRDLEASEREVERLARVVNALLALAREGERPSADARVDLGDAAGRAVERWQAVAEQDGMSLSLQGTEQVSARVSEEDVAVMLDNLISNALRHSSAGGEVTVQWRTEGELAALAVLDRGPGIDEADAERLFERFYRGDAKGDGAGSGLGLAIVRALARRWGGDAGIENRPQGGAGVSVRLQVAPISVASEDGRSSKAPQQTGAGR
jgi:two-component system, OmpR family, sensor kinase